MNRPGRVLLPYSGDGAGLVLLRTLAGRSDSDVVTLTLDLGQAGEGGLQHVRDAALAAGAARAHVIDVRDEYARRFMLPALRAGVADTDWVPLIRTLGRTLVEEKLREVAAIEGAFVEAGASAHDVNASLLGRIVDGPHTLTLDPARAPERPVILEIVCRDGTAQSINGVPLPLIELIDSLTTIAGQHGIGRIDGVEVPAAVVLSAALRTAPDGVVRLRLFKGACEVVPAMVTPS